MNRDIPVAVALLCAAAAGCAGDGQKPAVIAAAAPDAAPGKPVAGRACIDLQRIRESRVRSDKVIDFVMVDGQILRSRLPYGCPQLGFERAFTYATSLSQLCSTDIITVIVQGGGPSRGASCGLGEFSPISGDAAKAPLAAEDR